MSDPIKNYMSDIFNLINVRVNIFFDKM